MNFLINVITLILCVLILAFGGIQTVKQSNIEGLVKEFEIALESEPELPEIDNGENNEEKNPNKPESPVDPEVPDDPETPVDPETPDKPEPPDIPETPVEPEPTPKPETPDNPEPPPHKHSFVDGKCECGHTDPNYKPEIPDNPVEPEPTPKPEAPQPPALSSDETKDAFKEMYDSHDPDFTEVKKEILTDMITGILSSDKNDSTTEDSGSTDSGDGNVDSDEEDDFDFDFDTDTEFNPDEFVPDDIPEEDTSASEEDEIVSDVVNIYFDKLITEIENKQQENADKPTEEGDADGQAFVEKEAEALAGLVNIIDTAQSGDTPEDEKILQSVDAILGSNVCMDTVSTSTDTNSKFTEKAQEATNNIGEETKVEIQSKIETSLDEYRASENYDESKEKQYTDLANLFGVTLNNASGTPSIPDMEIPEDLIPEI